MGGGSVSAAPIAAKSTNSRLTSVIPTRSKKVSRTTAAVDTLPFPSACAYSQHVELEVFFFLCIALSSSFSHASNDTLVAGTLFVSYRWK